MPGPPHRPAGEDFPERRVIQRQQGGQRRHAADR